MINSAKEDRGLAQPSVAWRDLSIYGSRRPIVFQHTVLSYPGAVLQSLFHRKKRTPTVPIIQGFEGLIESGDLVLVIGQPGSGCTTFLKALSGRLDGLSIDPRSQINHKGR